MKISQGDKLAREFEKQDVHFFIKTSKEEFLIDNDIGDEWLGHLVNIPALKTKEDQKYNSFLTGSSFRAFVWLHESKGKNRMEKGLVALISLKFNEETQQVQLVDVEFFNRPVGEEVLVDSGDTENIFSKINRYRPNRSWPLSQADIEQVFKSIQDKEVQIALYEGDGFGFEDDISLQEIRQRNGQNIFRRKLIEGRGLRCAISGVTEENALEAAHIIPYASGYRKRNSLENGLLLRRDT